MHRIIAVFMLLLTSTAQSHATTDRETVIELLQYQCGITAETFAAAGFTSTEVAIALDSIEMNSTLPSAIEQAVNTLTSTGQAIAECQEQIRNRVVFDDDADMPTRAQLEAELTQLRAVYEDATNTLNQATHQLRIDALGSHLSAEMVARVSGEEPGWARLPIPWRFGVVSRTEMHSLASAYRQAQRLESANQDIPTPIESLINSIESQYPVSLASTRIASSTNSVRQAIQVWVSN